MIDFKCDREKDVFNVEFQGDIEELVSEILALVHVTHTIVCKEQGVIKGLLFDTYLCNLIPECMKPIKGDEIL